MKASANILVELGSLCRQLRGVSYKPEDASPVAKDGYRPLLRANNISNGEINHDEVVYVRQEKVADAQYLLFGDILICASSGSRSLVGKAAQYREGNGETFGAFCKVLRPDVSKLDVEYIKHYFQTDGYRRIISNKAAGANINNIRSSDLDELIVPVPEMSLQREIAAVLDRICVLKRNAEAQLAQLKLLAKSQFVEMFGDLNVNPKGWRTDRLGEVCDVRDGTHASPKYHDVGYPLMTSKNFANGYEDFSDVKLISEEDFLEINKRSKVDAGDIVMPMIGTIGHPVIVRAEREYAIKNVALIKFYKESPCNVYVKAVFESSYFERTVAGTSRGNTQKFIALGDIRSFGLPLPPLALQREYAAFIEQLDKSLFAVNKLIEQYDLLYRAKLQEYFG